MPDATKVACFEKGKCTNNSFFFRMAMALTDMDGPSWREKLPPIPTVPMHVKEKIIQAANSNVKQNGIKERSDESKKMFVD